jgi:hypothetical protein
MSREQVWDCVSSLGRGVRIDSNDDSGFWLEVLFPKTSQPKETVVKKDDGDEDDDDEDDDDAFRHDLLAYFKATVENNQAAAIHGGRVVVKSEARLGSQR